MQILCAVLVGIMIAASIYLILDRNLIRFIFGLVLASNAINLLILTAGRLASRRPPLIPDKMTMGQELFANALPQALILTAIVIGVGILALALGLAVRTYALFGTLDTRELAELRTGAELRRRLLLRARRPLRRRRSRLRLRLEWPRRGVCGGLLLLFGRQPPPPLEGQACSPEPKWWKARGNSW